MATIKTKFDIGQHVQYVTSYGEKPDFMRGKVEKIHTSTGEKNSYSIRYDDPKTHSGWRNMFDEDELELIP